MKLTVYTDYAIRVVMHLGVVGDRLASIGEISQCYGISQNHLMKVVQDLGNAGYVETVRGRNGGIRLARTPVEINLGKLIRHTESGFDLVDCPNCLIAPACGLPSVLAEATNAFLSVLDKYTVADLIVRRSSLRNLFNLDMKAPGRVNS